MKFQSAKRKTKRKRKSSLKFKTFKNKKAFFSSSSSSLSSSLSSNLPPPFCSTSKNCSFLQACFHYYQECIFASCASSKKSKSYMVSELLTIATNNGPIFVIDYPNVIYTLHEHYRNRKTVIRKFYSFLYHLLFHLNANIFIVAKIVLIENKYDYSIAKVLEDGNKGTKHVIPLAFFQNKQISVFEIQYVPTISSSVDDLLGYFIALVLYAFMIHAGKNPLAKDPKTGLQKLNMMTNDKQNFDKNLFGKNKHEYPNTVLLFHILPQVQKKEFPSVQNKEFPSAKYKEFPSVQKKEFPSVQNKEFPSFIKTQQPKDEAMFRDFLSTYVINKMHDTGELSCFLIGIIDKLNLLKNSSSSSSSSKCSFLISYAPFLASVKKIQHELCFQPIQNSISPSMKKYSFYYLYVLIKCLQARLFQNNLFGSMSKEEIIGYFSFWFFSLIFYFIFPFLFSLFFSQKWKIKKKITKEKNFFFSWEISFFKKTFSFVIFFSVFYFREKKREIQKGKYIFFLFFSFIGFFSLFFLFLSFSLKSEKSKRKL